MEYARVEAKLAQVRSPLEALLASIPEADWKRTPVKGGWSVGEIIAHLIQVESAIQLAGSKAIAQEPKPLKRRFPPPIFLVKYRGIKRETPIPLDAQLVTTKAEMLAKFAARRHETLAFLREAISSGRDLRRVHWRHPFFGPLTFAEWCRLIGNHEIRHTKQIREIVSSFQS